MLTARSRLFTIGDVYQRFARMYADSTPIRNLRELDAADPRRWPRLHRITLEWLRDLNPAWVYGETGAPFASDLLNRRYIRMLQP